MWIGWVAQTHAVHLGLCCVPRHQPYLLVFKASERCLLLECQGRVPGRGQWCGRGLLAAAATSGAPRFTNKEHPHLLRQSQHRLPHYQPIQHHHMKHVEIDLHFMRKRVTIGDVHVLCVPMTSQFTNIFTTGLPTLVFLEFQLSRGC
jgi:hypothetical protein